MKKYVKPIARLVNIDPTAILAGSLGVNNNPTNEMLSKQNSFYDLDEEEEY